MAIVLNGTTGISSPGGDVSVSQSLSGNLTFTGTGNRITGDFSNGTIATRVGFQTSTTNGNTNIPIWPNGTANQTAIVLNNANSSTADRSTFSMLCNGATDATIRSGITGTGTYLPMTFYTGGSERLRLDTSGNLGLGVTPSAWGGIKSLQVGTAASFSGGSGFNDAFVVSNAFYDGANWKYINSNTAYYASIGGAAAARWYTAPSGTAGNAVTFTERMRIGADGFTNVFVTSNDGITSRNSVAAGTSNAFFVGRHSATGVTDGTISFIVWSNGNVVNTNNSYGAISDIKLKENIVPTSPKLDKLMQVEVVNYNLKDNPDQKLLGVVAQQLEQVFPSLVEESPDRDEEGNDLGTTTKSVKYSVFVPMLIKAVQELTARLEVLENK